MNLKALSITEASSRTGINRHSLIRLIKAQQIAANQIGRKYFVSEESLYAWLHRQPERSAPVSDERVFPEAGEDIFS